MDAQQKVLFVDAATGYYRLTRFPVGDFFGPVDLGLHLAGRFNSLNIGVGLLAGSILPGSNRLDRHRASRRAGAASTCPRWAARAWCSTTSGSTWCRWSAVAPPPSVLVLNRHARRRGRRHVVPVDLPRIWATGGRGGIYALHRSRVRAARRWFRTTPRILATGPAAQATDFGAIGSVPMSQRQADGTWTRWAGRGGFGSQMLQQHNIAAVIYGGTFVDEDFRDRTVADELVPGPVPEEAAARRTSRPPTKYRYDPKCDTGGTLRRELRHRSAARCCRFNYRQHLHGREAERIEIHEKLHRQPLPATVQRGDHRSPSSSARAASRARRCARRCADEFKKDYEPYQTMGPLCGDLRPAGRRALEPPRRRARLRRHLRRRRALVADGVPAEGAADAGRARVSRQARVLAAGFSLETDSAAQRRRSASSCSTPSSPSAVCWIWRKGPRKLARRLAREKGKAGAGSLRLHRLRAQGLDGAEPVLDAGRSLAHGYHGQVLHVLRGRVPAAPRKLGRINAERFGTS